MILKVIKRIIKNVYNNRITIIELLDYWIIESLNY